MRPHSGAYDTGRPVNKQATFKITTISLYNEDLERVDAMVKELKARGQKAANRSSVIRHALRTLNVNEIPKGHER